MNDDSLLMRLASGRRLQAVQPPIIPAIVALIRAHPGTISLGQGIGRLLRGLKALVTC